jgi:hypothetical protein
MICEHEGCEEETGAEWKKFCKEHYKPPEKTSRQKISEETQKRITYGLCLNIASRKFSTRSGMDDKELAEKVHKQAEAILEEGKKRKHW